MTERYLSCEKRCGALAIILLLGIICCPGGSVYAVDGTVPSGTLDYKLVSLSYISPEQGKEYLSRVGLATASPMPQTKSLLVTAEADELRKAVAVLGVVDAPQTYGVARLGPASAAGALPSNERIADAVGHVTIGTFANPPRGINKSKVIIDTHNGSVVAVAPMFQLQDIKLAVELGPEALKQQKESARYTRAGGAAPMMQATEMAEVSAEAKVEQAQKPGATEADRQTWPSLPREMQEKLRELQRRAAEAQAQRQSALSAATRPIPAASPEREPAGSTASFGQAEDQAVDSNTPDGLEQVGAEPQTQSAPQQASEPLTGEQNTLQPGQVIPSEPPQATESPEEPAKDTVQTETSNPPAQTKPGPTEYGPAQFANGDQVISLTLPERLPVIQLLDLVGKYLNLSYIYDPAKVTGEVTLKLNGNLQGSMKVKDLYLLLESVLQCKDLVMTRHKGNIVRIAPKAEIMTVDPKLVDPESCTVEAGDAVVTRVFDLKNIDTVSADNLLQQMGLSVGVTSIMESGTLIVTAYAHRMSRIEHLLDMVDKPGEPRRFTFRQLRYTMAQTLAEKVKALAEQLEGVSVTVGEGDPTANVARLPGESEAAWRARLVRAKAAQAQAVALLRSRTPGAAVPGQGKPAVYLDADDRTNRILMIGVEKQLGVVEQLIDALDVEQQDLRTLELYRIRHVDADEVARKLQELGIISKLPESNAPGRITGSSRTTSSMAGQPPRPGIPMPEVPMAAEVTEGGLVGEPQVVVVESTNSLLVNATAEQHAQIELIIGYVDSEMDMDEIPYKIYPLENSSPKHLTEILEGLIQETIEQDKEGKIEKTVISREEKVKIVPDPNTYSLIVYANKKNQEWIANLVEQLDKRRPQVLIDVTLVEITETDEFNYDLNLVQSFPDLAATSGLTGALAGSITSPGIIDKLNTSGRDRFIDFQSDSGNLTAFYGDKHINALLTAMNSKNYGRVLAKPKILVNDNEEGTIKTTDTTYVKTTSSIPYASGTAGQQTQLLQTSESFNEYDAGIELGITPHISEGELLRLDIALTRSDFRGTASVERPPDKTTSEIATAVTVPNGSTIILGGLIRLNQNKGGTKVPILGDIPLIGGLFRSINNKDTQSKLYVFVKAEIIRPAATLAGGMHELEEISERNRMAFERHEEKFQEYESWPGIKSQPVPPQKVLEAQ